MTLTGAIRRALKRFRTADEAISAIDDIKINARNVNINPITDMFENLNYNVVNTRLTANGFPLNELESLVRRGEIIQFGRNVNSSAVIRASDQTGFVRTLRDIPDVRLKQLDDKIAATRLVNPDLDIMAPNGQQLYNNMTPLARSKFESAMNKIKAAAGPTLIVAGVVGIIIIGVDFYQSIVEATENRRGCFLIREINNQTTSCKIMARSCNPASDTTNSCQTIPSELKYNTTLFLMSIVGTPTATTVGNLLSIGGPVTNVNIPQIIANADDFELARDYYYNTSTVTITNPCSYQVVGVEGNIVPLCRACVPSANINSTEYVDNSDLADNYTLQCVATTSILDTLVDVGVGLGLDLFNLLGSFSGNLSGNIPLLSGILIFIFILIIGVVVFFRFGKNKKS